MYGGQSCVKLVSPVSCINVALSLCFNQRRYILRKPRYGKWVLLKAYVSMFLFIKFRPAFVIELQAGTVKNSQISSSVKNVKLLFSKHL